MKYLYVPPQGPYMGQRFTNPQPTPLDPNTADFTDLGDRQRLASLGIFSIDRADKRAQLRRIEAQKHYVGGAFAYLGLDRGATEAAALETVPTAPGIWARSTAAGIAARNKAVNEVVTRAEARGYGARPTPTGSGHYLDPELDAIIAVALARYAEHPNTNRDKREKAAEFAYALNNDTWLLASASGPEDWQSASDSVGG